MENKKIIEILNKWAIYSKYDKTQTQFNLLSCELDFHNINKRIEMILKKYDKTGALAVLQAKIGFEVLLQNTKINLYDVFSNSTIYKDESEMFQLFCSEEVIEIENNYIKFINNLSLSIINKTLIGENNIKFKDLLFEKTDDILSVLETCNEMVLKKGNKLSEINHFSTNIHIFNSVKECLTNLNDSLDGIYLCYINENKSIESYFGFLIKNNGNIIFYNDKVLEQYKNQHDFSRNNHWIDSKVAKLFPYEFMIDFDKYDYKGYANEQKLKNDFNQDGKNIIPLNSLPEEGYIPIIIAMYLLINKYKNISLEDKNLYFTENLLPINLQLDSNKNELALIDEGLIESHKNLNLNFELKKILDGSYVGEFTNSSDWDECGIFSNKNQIFVDLYGQDFDFDISEIFKSSDYLLDSCDEKLAPEFLGTEKKFRLFSYYKIREQLANHIKKNIYQEYVNCGGIKFIKSWYKDLINQNFEILQQYIVKHYLAIKNGEERNTSSNWRDTTKTIDFYYSNKTYAEGHMGVYYFNESLTNKSLTPFKCPITGTIANQFFVIKPKDYLAIEELFQIKVPKIVKGWHYDGHRTCGNSILNITDCVEEVGTPFENYISRSKEYKGENCYFEFDFTIGFSKRGLNQLIKKYKEAD